MNNWTNYIFKFTLFILLIGHIRSLDSGETVFNKNFIVLESISDWEGFRQSTDQLHRSLNDEKSSYFLVKEDKNFNLLFKDNVSYTSQFDKFNECDSKLNVTYSFEYFLDLNPKIKNLNWTINFLNNSEEVVGLTKRWSLESNSVQLDDLNELETKFTNKPIFEMQIRTVDKYDLGNTKNEIRFAIKNLKLIFSCRSIRTELNFSLEKTGNSQFIFERNGKLQTNYQLIDSWSNSVFPNFVNGIVDKYYYTEKSSKKLNFIIAESDFEKEEEICLSFDYFVTKNAILSIKYINKLLENTTLLKLYSSELNERLINDQVSPKEIKLHWNNATVCVKAEQILAANEKNPIPQWSFESFIDKPESKENIIAVTNFRAFRRMQNDLKNYIPNWKFNGKKVLNDWHIVPRTPNFGFNLSEDHQLKLYLRELPTDTERHYHMISDWFTLDTDKANYLTFRLNSNLTNYQLKVVLNSFLIGTIDEKIWSLNSAIKNRLMQFDLKNASKHLELVDKSKFRVVFEIYNKPIIEKNKVNDDQKRFEKHPDEQLLTISEIQLADECTNEFICRGRGVCQSSQANKAKCECQKEWHGEQCEFMNKCNLKNEFKNFNKTGNEYCNMQGRQCVPEEDNFICKCEETEFWDTEILECNFKNDCLFQECGLNEECSLKDSVATCDCKATYRRNKDNICIKDLCLDPQKKCPKNQHCLHVENEVNPICYCPIGTYQKSGPESECIDSRKKPRLTGEEKGPEIDPFVLQYYGCEQDYSVDKDAKVTCKCLPGYRSTTNKRCEPDFDTKSCNCKKNEICIQKDDTVECVCKPGYFGDECVQNICNGHRSESICGKKACYVNDSNKFVCNCDKHLYNVGNNGLCESRDVCAEKSITCSEHASCVGQLTTNPYQDHSDLTPQCACKHGLASSKESDRCVDPCIENKDQCDHVQFSECKLVHDMNEIKCSCKPGMWRKGLTDPCTPAKSSTQMNLLFVPKDTNVNPVHKKDRRKLAQYLNINKINNLFNLTKRRDDLRRKIRPQRSIFRLTPSGLAFSRLATKYAIDKTLTSADVVNARYTRIYSVKNECYGNLDYKGCINNWNKAYQAINKLPPGKMSRNFVESMIRKSLLDTFNIVFNKKIDSVIVLSYEPEGEIDIDNFGLKTFYNVNFLVQSNEIDLSPELIKDALINKCKFSKVVEESNFCSIDDQSILVLSISNLKAEVYDACETKMLKCEAYNECYNRRKEDPDFDFKKDQIVYECKCKKGFKSVHVNEAHFTHFLNHTCEDIDECASPDLNNCEETSTTCVNLIGSFRCDCDKGYKRLDETKCVELCSDSTCVNGICKKLGDHNDYCECFDDWKGINCTESNTKLSTYKVSIIIIIVIALIVLVFIVIGFIFYGKGYTKNEVDKRTISLKHELEMAKLAGNQRSSPSAETNIKHYSEGQTNPAFESHRN